MPTKRWLHACCRTPLNQRGQSFVFNGMRVRMRAMCVRLRVLLAAPRHVLSPFLKRYVKIVWRDIPSTRSRYNHVRKQVSKQWHLDHCASVQFHSNVHQMPRHVTLCGYVERQEKFAFMFWSEVNQQVVESGTFMGTHVVTFVSLFILCLSVVHAGSLKTGQLWPG